MKRLVVFLKVSLSSVFAILGAIMLLWMVTEIHPGYSREVISDNSISIDCLGSVDTFAYNIRIDTLGAYLADSEIMRKHYEIPEGLNYGPVPNPENFGCIETADAELVYELYDRAVMRGLMEDGETVVFNADATFCNGSVIDYYLDDTLLVVCWKEKINGKSVNCAEIRLADASQIRRRVTDDTYGSSKLLFATEIAANTNCVLGINADFYMFRNLGITCYEGTIYRFGEAGYGANYSYNCLDTLFIDSNGDFVFFERGTTTTKDELQQEADLAGYRFGVSFGPILVKDGEKQNITSYPIGEYDESYTRAGIGQVSTLHYLYMSTNAYGSGSCTMNEFAGMIFGKGVVDAYNLDGGQTSEMIFNGNIYNHIDYENERAVSDIIYFSTAIPEDEWQ